MIPVTIGEVVQDRHTAIKYSGWGFFFMRTAFIVGEYNYADMLN